MKSLIPIVLVVLVLGGGFAAAKMGFVNIPGVSPETKQKNAAAEYTEGEEGGPLEGEEAKVAATPAPEPPKPEPPKKPAPRPAPKPTVDYDRGRRELAKLWNEIEPKKLAPMVEDWKDEELAKQLAVMDGAKVAKLLSILEPKRASRLSRLLMVEGSKIGAGSGAPNP
ncbi:MAG: hypothetical protein SNJ74_09640 [Fimbriimonadaceae bacterium]